MKTAKEIKKWLDETSDEFIQWFEASDINIPEGIRFVTANSRNNLLGLIFNEGKQILAFHDIEKVFQVFSYSYNISKGYCKEVPCKLVECKYEDLQVGDIFIYCSKEEDIKDKKESLEEYILFLGDDNFIFIDENKDIINFNLITDSYTNFYKVVKK